MTSSLAKLEERIHNSTNAVVSHLGQTDDAVAGAVVGRNTVVHLVINGSFLYRDKSVKTSQSTRRLLARLTASGKRVRTENISIIDGETIKTHYKMIPCPIQAK